MARIADAGFDEVSVSVLYHGGMLLLPHNPRRRVYFPEDGVVYFAPDSRRYQGGPLQPVPSELTKSGDPLAEISVAAASHGLTTVAWLVTLHNARLGLHHPDFTLENAYGDHYPYALCPSQPEVGTFFEALVQDLSRYPVGAIELEALYHQSYPHAWSHPKEGVRCTEAQAQLLSLCFCPACLAHAAEQGVDGDRVRVHVRRVLDDDLRRDPAHGSTTGNEWWSVDQLGSLVPGADGYVAARTRAVTSLLGRVCAASQLPVHGIIGSGLLGREWQPGIALPDWAARCHGLTVNCYQSGRFGTFEEEVAEARGRTDGALYIGLQATWPQVSTASDLGLRIAQVRAAAADGVAIYNYGLMPSRHLAWVKDALEEVVGG